VSIHSRATRLCISAGVFLIVLFLVMPHLMDVEPPLIVNILLKPVELLAKLIHSISPPPCHNMGTPEHPICEGTPVDLLIGLFFVFFGILLYPVVTYLLLSLLSKLVKCNRQIQ
jgi:hypothetical protein